MTGFDAWWSAREPSLRAAVHAVTGDAAVTHALVRDAAAGALVSGMAGADALDDLVHARIAAALGPGADDADDADEPVIWDYLSTLPPRKRLDVALEQLDGGSGPGDTVSDLAALLAVDDATARTRLGAVLARRSTEGAPTAVRAVDVAAAAAAHRRRTRRRLGVLTAALAALLVLVPALVVGTGGLPGPERVPTSRQTPAVREAGAGASEIRNRVPPPWVLLPEVRRARLMGGTTRVQLETNCSNPADEEFRSLTVIRARCRTEVVERR